MTRLIQITAVTIVACAGAIPLAQSKTDFTGTWVVDQAKTLALGPPDMRGGGSVGTNSLTAGLSSTPWTLTQTATTLTLVRQLPDGSRQRYVYALDGSESVNTNGGLTLKTRSRWEGGSLVTEGTQAVATDGSAGATAFKEVRSIDADGSMHVATTRLVGNGTPLTAHQALVKK